MLQGFTLGLQQLNRRKSRDKMLSKEPLFYTFAEGSYTTSASIHVHERVAQALMTPTTATAPATTPATATATATEVKGNVWMTGQWLAVAGEDCS
jgi:hypothetical protein